MVKKILIIAGILVLLAAAIIGGSRLFTDLSIKSNVSDVETLSKNFLDSLRAAKYDEAYNYLSTDGKKNFPVSKLKEFKVPEVTFTNKPVVTPDDATIVSGDNKTKKYVKLTMVKEGQGWKVADILIYSV